MHARPKTGIFLFSVLNLLLSVILCPPTTMADSYIAGQVGMALPSLGKGLSDIDTTTQFIPGTTHSDLALQNSFLYGGKLGHYFKSARWFGIETEVFNTTPNIKQQTHSFENSGVVVTSAAPLQGAHFRVLTWAPLNLIIRYPKTRLQPYIGVGPGIFFGRISGEGLGPQNPTSVSDNWRIGLNAKAGLEYYITRRLTVFGEWKYNYTRFSFKENPDLFPFPYGFKATYSTHLVSFGLGYHF